MKYYLLIIPFILASYSVKAQAKDDSLFIRKIYDQALSKGQAYEDLRFLCKNIGARLAGSVPAQMAVQWGFEKLKSYGFDTVYLQEIQVPNWKRGTKESAFLTTAKGEIIPLDILALGGSIHTNGTMLSEIIVFQDLEELRRAAPERVKGKVAFVNQLFDPTQVNTFASYSTCASTRHWCGIEAARKGAVAVIIRSVSSSTDHHPHTGGMAYADSVHKIPGAAVSTLSADLILKHSLQGKLSIHLEMDCRTLPDVVSYNVIGELRGKKNPNKYISVGGHLDSWDVGEGAHDDGAGIVHSIEALRILKTLNYRPNNTLRVVLFMNEENGNRGGISYAEYALDKKEIHIAAIESDRGGFTPRGFTCDGTSKQVQLLQSFDKLLKPYNLHLFEKGYGGVDINPLKKKYNNICLFGFYPDEQRYFDLHHTEADVFETVNKRELELGCASISSLIYLLDKNL